ncbi:MAG: hypothetical protein C4576_12240 [Desulfobacteraceae bacterium]|nr:MAG: hypothetical protein C4576_12240 [Desulfobacteraceae bacterium]
MEVKPMSKPEEKKSCQIEIPFSLEHASVVKRLRLPKSDGRLEEMVSELFEKSSSIARMRAVYLVSRARVIDRETVDIDGASFTSRALSRNLIDQETVFPFIATVGRELDEFSAPAGNVMMQFSLDWIKTMALVSAVDYLAEFLKAKYRLGDLAHMNPGEIEDWPITAQKPLFDLFHGAEKRVGVTLTQGGLMKPIKSRSGILFPNEKGFVSCLLCTQQRCPGRRAHYSPEKVKEFLD